MSWDFECGEERAHLQSRRAVNTPKPKTHTTPKHTCLIHKYVRTHIHTYIHTYIHVVELKIGPRFGGVCVKNWSKSCVKNWSKFFFVSLSSPMFIVFGGTFKNTSSVNLCPNSVFAKWSGCQKWSFRKENCIFRFCLVYVAARETENGKSQQTL